MANQQLDILEIFLKKGYLKQNVVISDIVIDSPKKYQHLYKSSKGSYSDFENGWCFFYTVVSNDASKVKGILHKVNKGVPFITEEIERAQNKYKSLK